MKILIAIAVLFVCGYGIHEFGEYAEEVNPYNKVGEKDGE